ncbi:MAG: hypothetical protein WC851_04690 [Candidatus Shapirobacteria bacterium]|jgi:hypothetical protein
MKSKIDLNELGKLICKQAEEKGWGHTKETLVVSEKMILISTEITELEEARNNKDTLPKDTMASEYADVLTRTLHLGTAWGVDFNKEFNYESNIKSVEGNFDYMDLLYLHDLVAKGYEAYRHKEITEFMEYLKLIAYEVIKMSEADGVDIEKGAREKMEINMPRVWSKNDLNGSYTK